MAKPRFLKTQNDSLPSMNDVQSQYAGKRYDAVSSAVTAIIDGTTAPSPEAYMYRGKVHFQKKHYKQAINDFELFLGQSGVKSKDVVGDAHVHIGMSKGFLGNHTSAVDSITKGFVANSKTVSKGLLHRARNYELMGKYREALADVNKVLDTTSSGQSLGQALAQRGNIYRHSGKYNKALKDLNKAVNMVTDPIVTLYRGIAHAALKNEEQARVDMKNAGSGFKDQLRHEWLYYQGLVYFHLEEYYRASDYFEQAIVEFKKVRDVCGSYLHPQLLATLGLTEIKLAKINDARQNLTAALYYLPSHPDFLCWRKQANTSGGENQVIKRLMHNTITTLALRPTSFDESLCEAICSNTSLERLEIADAEIKDNAVPT